MLVLVVGIGGAIMCFGKSERDPEIKMRPPQAGTLIINNGAAITENVVIHFRKNANYADLPLTEVMKNLGMTVTWVDSNTADITYNDKKYVLNLSEASLVEDGKTGNYIIPPPGSKTFGYKVLENELILDSVTVFCILYDIKKVDIRIDPDNLIVNIFDRAD